jgi:hypothetical protein
MSSNGILWQLRVISLLLRKRPNCCEQRNEAMGHPDSCVAANGLTIRFLSRSCAGTKKISSGVHF